MNENVYIGGFHMSVYLYPSDAEDIWFEIIEQLASGEKYDNGFYYVFDFDFLGNIAGNFKGEVPIQVDMLDEKGNQVSRKVKIEIDFEDETGEVDANEYISEFLAEKVLPDFEQSSKGILFASDEEGIVEVDQVADLKAREYFTGDIETYVKEVTGLMVTDEFLPVDLKGNLNSNFLGYMFRHAFKKTNLVGKGHIGTIHLHPILDYEGSTTLVNRYHFFPVHVSHGIVVNGISATISYIKRIALIGDKKELERKIQDVEDKINEFMRTDWDATSHVGIRFKNENKREFTVKKNRSEQQYLSLLEELSKYKDVLVLFSSHDVYQKYEGGYKGYASHQALKFRYNERYRKIASRYSQVLKHSKVLSERFNKQRLILEVPLGQDTMLVVGFHYALIVQGGQYKVIYNVLEDEGSIQKAKGSISSYKGKAGSILEVALMLADGRKRITGEKIDQYIYGERRAN